MNRSIDDEVTPLISTSGIPAVVRDNRQPREKQLAVYGILVCTLFERIAFYTVVSNLAANLETSAFKGDDNNGTITAFIFSGTSYISTILFAIISDAKLGRAKTVIIGFFIYLVGYASAIVINIPYVYAHFCVQSQSNTTSDLQLSVSFDDPCNSWVLVSLIIIAIGSGSVQSNLVILGVEQIPEAKLAARYFDKYIIAVNLGGIIASMTFVYMADREKTAHSSTYLYPCILATSALLVAALIFLINWKYYIHVSSYESVITKFFPVIINALQARRKYYREKAESINLAVTSNDSSYLNMSYNVHEDDRPRNFLDFAKFPHGKCIARVVDDVKSLCKAMIVFFLLIPYFLIYNQLTSTFSPQATAMKDANEYTVKLVWLGDPIIIILGVLILNTFICKLLKNRHITVSITTRLVIGMCFAILSMIAAAIVEYYRQDKCNSNNNLSIYWQLPQNIFVGFSELFTMLSSFEYVYLASPRSGQTLFMSLRFCSIGISSFVGFGYMAAIAAPARTLDFSCEQTQNSAWEFYTYFLGLAGIQFFFMIIFIICQKKFHIIKYNRQRIATNQFFRRSTSLTPRRLS